MIRDDLALAVRRALADAALPEPPGPIVLEPPRQRDRGDFSTPVALSLQKIVGGSPLDIAEKIVKALEAADVPHLARAEVAKPGFVNLYLARTWLHDVLRDAVAVGESYGTSEALADQRINLEFVSANPTGPLHAGGGRWVAVGDAIANILAAQGAHVHREYYLNDTGNQLATFRDSLYARYKAEPPPEDGYQGQYLVDLAGLMRAELGDDVTPDQACEWGVQRIVEGLNADLARIGVRFDTWFSERSLHERNEVADVLLRARREGRRVRRGRRPLAALDRVRRLPRSCAREVRRIHDVSLQRPRVPPRQARARLEPPDRHLGRRPSRAGEVDAGRHAGARVRTAPEPEVLLGQLVKLVRDGTEVRISKRTGNIDHARRHPRRSRS